MRWGWIWGYSNIYQMGRERGFHEGLRRKGQGSRMETPRVYSKADKDIWQIILGVPGVEAASGWEVSCYISSEVGPSLPEEISLASPLFPPADSLCHRAGWQAPEISDRRNLFFKSKVSGRQMLSNPKRKVSRSGCLTLLLPPAEFWKRIYIFWEVLCETPSGSEKIHPFVIWRLGGTWNLESTVLSIWWEWECEIQAVRQSAGIGKASENLPLSPLPIGSITAGVFLTVKLYLPPPALQEMCWPWCG